MFGGLTLTVSRLRGCMGSMRDFMRVRGVRRVLVVVEDHNQEEVMVKYQVEVLKDQYQLGGGQDQVQELVEDQELV